MEMSNDELLNSLQQMIDDAVATITLNPDSDEMFVFRKEIPGE